MQGMLELPDVCARFSPEPGEAHPVSAAPGLCSARDVRILRQAKEVLFPWGRAMSQHLDLVPGVCCILSRSGDPWTFLRHQRSTVPLVFANQDCEKSGMWEVGPSTCYYPMFQG